MMEYGVDDKPITATTVVDWTRCAERTLQFYESIAALLRQLSLLPV